jgi:Rho-binding antiterminator
MINDSDRKGSDGEVYTPIDCALYSRYEVAILHRTPLQLRWRDEAGRVHDERVIARDLQIRDHGEYLIVASGNGDGEPFAVRLDQILNPEASSR